MQGSRQRGAPRQDEGAQRRQTFVEGVAISLEFLDPWLLNPQRRVLVDLQQRGAQVGSDIEEIVLNASDHRRHSLWDCAGGGCDSESAVGFVSVGVRHQSGIHLGGPTEVTQ